MDKLWAPWRMKYVRAKKDENGGCVFCIIPKQDKDRDNLLLYRGKSAFVVMNLYPYNNGHIMICPYEHLETTETLSKKCMAEVMVLADQSMDILRRLKKAQGFNFGANIGTAGGAGIAYHLHFHVVPRWVGDTNFMPVLGHTKVMVDGLLDTYDILKTEFNKLN